MLRVWLTPTSNTQACFCTRLPILAARGVGINEVVQAVAQANVNLPTGTLYGKDRMFAVQATDLRPPAVWTPVTDAVPSLVGGQMTVIVPIGPGDRFFRLRLATVPTLPLSLSRAGSNLVIAWQINPWNCMLESTASLTPPVIWTPVSSPAPAIVSGQNTVTMPITGGTQFFRLHGTP